MIKKPTWETIPHDFDFTLYRCIKVRGSPRSRLVRVKTFSMFGITTKQASDIVKKIDITDIYACTMERIDNYDK